MLKIYLAVESLLFAGLEPNNNNNRNINQVSSSDQLLNLKRMLVVSFFMYSCCQMCKKLRLASP